MNNTYKTMAKAKGQTLEIGGKIIPDVNVKVVNENVFTTTDIDGYFELIANSPASILRFTHVGYTTVDISIEDFMKYGYIEIPSSDIMIEDINIIAPKPIYKKTDYTWLWIAAGIAGFISYKKLSKKPTKVKV